MDLVTPPSIVVLTAGGQTLAHRIAALFPGALVHGLKKRVTDADVYMSDVGSHLQQLYLQGRPLIGICSTGILVRLLAPVIADKATTPFVVAVAEDGSAVVPLLGGHRGANDCALKIAELHGTNAAITTAGDRRLNVALDEPPPGWRLANPQHCKAFTARLLAGEKLRLTGEAGWIAQSTLPLADRAELQLCISETNINGSPDKLVYHPATLAVGVGCERNVDGQEVIQLVEQSLAEYDLAAAAIAGFFSIDLKADEAALHALASHFGLPLRFFTASLLERQTARLATPSEIVFREVGCHGVAEGAALAAVGASGELIVSKRKSRRATCAIARARAPLDVNTMGKTRGMLYVVGIGPGASAWRTPEAERAVRRASDLVAYSLYLDLLGPLATGKNRHVFQLGEEEKRVRCALELAAQGKTVALICSGDPGIYAMATLVFELLERERHNDWQRVDIQIVPGISALQAAAARAGAPLGHDFCAISLSDLLTPWESIQRRITAAGEGDFVIAFYNPVSRRRTWQLARAVEILRRHRDDNTPVVLARNLGRPNERLTHIKLCDLTAEQVDMLTVILVGSRSTRRINHFVYTPRGYARKSIPMKTL